MFSHFRDAIILCLLGEATSLYAGFAVFSVLGFMAQQANVPIETVVKSGKNFKLLHVTKITLSSNLKNLMATTLPKPHRFTPLSSLCMITSLIPRNATKGCI